MTSAQLIIVPPHDAPEAAREFVVRCILNGVEFYFEDGDVLPRAVPAGLSDVRGIIIEDDLFAANEQAIAKYVSQGASVYRMRRANSASVPNATLAWSGDNTFHAICFDAGVTYRNPRFAGALQSRDDLALCRALTERILQSDNFRWYDATRYQWEGMLDAYELLRDPRFLEVVRRQVHNAIDNHPNDLTNCDTVAPIAAVVRLAKITGDATLIGHARRMFDQYLQITPRYRGCLVNFVAYPNSVRAEIQFQVLPSLLALARATGDEGYMRFAMEEYARLHELLFDREWGLWNHGIGRAGHSGAFWARGVAFTFLADSIMLELGDVKHPAYELCRGSFAQGAATLAKYQDPKTGFWTCVIDQPDSQSETSGPAWICAALERGMRLGHLPPATYRAVSDRAWNACKTRIWQGDIPGHMTATTVSSDRIYYCKKPLNDSGWPHFGWRAAAERMRNGRITAAHSG